MHSPVCFRLLSVGLSRRRLLKRGEYVGSDPIDGNPTIQNRETTFGSGIITCTDTIGEEFTPKVFSPGRGGRDLIGKSFNFKLSSNEVNNTA